MNRLRKGVRVVGLAAAFAAAAGTSSAQRVKMIQIRPRLAAGLNPANHQWMIQPVSVPERSAAAAMLFPRAPSNSLALPGSAIVGIPGAPAIPADIKEEPLAAKIDVTGFSDRKPAETRSERAVDQLESLPVGGEGKGGVRYDRRYDGRGAAVEGPAVSAYPGVPARSAAMMADVPSVEYNDATFTKAIYPSDYAHAEVRAIDAATARIDYVTPGDFVPIEVRRALRRARGRGVQVRVLGMRGLRVAGAKVREMRAPGAHEGVIVDGRLSLGRPHVGGTPGAASAYTDPPAVDAAQRWFEALWSTE